jgi:DNA-binding MarR family transcriptional regulator
MSDVVSITELLSYRISRVSNALSRGAALRYRREFDVSLGEWRTLALLGARAPLGLGQLARLAGLDKAQVSRAVSRLTERALVQRAPGPGRLTLLTLTDRGHQVYLGLMTAANDRERILQASLTAQEREVFDSVLHKLADVALDLESRERDLQRHDRRNGELDDPDQGSGELDDPDQEGLTGTD